MEKTKLLTFAIIGLLVLNFATLGFLFLRHPEPHGPEGRPQRPREIIINKLHFDAAQQKQYDSLIDWHRGTISKIDDNIREAKNRLYLQLLKPEADPRAKDSLINVISANQKQIELTHFKHFSDIRKICKKDQLDDYNELTHELAMLFSPPPPPRHD